MILRPAQASKIELSQKFSIAQDFSSVCSDLGVQEIAKNTSSISTTQQQLRVRLLFTYLRR